MTDQDDRIDRELLDAWEVPEPPADLADRVLVALSKKQPEARPRRWPWLAGVGVAALASAAALVLLLRGGREATGATVADQRETLRLGDRGLAVAEPGATLSWTVATDGAARVEQAAGDVFYRVERGEPFVVSTPAGDVTVLGTCFRVEVSPMRTNKQTMTGVAIGAAASAIIVVSVYEGKVLLANERGRVELAAGDKAMARGDSAPLALADQPAPAELTAPAAGATREDLLRRDEDHRAELSILRDRVKRLEAEKVAGLGAGGWRERGETFVDPTKEELLDYAKECRIAFDTPGITLEPFELDDREAAELALGASERGQLERRLNNLHGRILEELRALYVEVTGDRSGAESLSPTALAEEITSKSPREETQLILQKISHERAGLLQPPASLQGTSAAERYYRLMTRVGDDFERELGAVIGPERAHALRKKEDGWGHKHGMSHGCPK
jgi:ferric-dicitrate binding protein FerR (iron transport regulator)